MQNASKNSCRFRHNCWYTHIDLSKTKDTQSEDQSMSDTDISQRNIPPSEHKGTPVPETSDTQEQPKETYAHKAAVPLPNNTAKSKTCQNVEPEVPKGNLSNKIQERHAYSRTKDGWFKCPVCKREYKYKKDLNKHINENHHHIETKTKRWVKCINCHNAYKSEDELTVHINDKHIADVRKYCRDCQMKFKSRNDFQQHQVDVHSDVRRHVPQHSQHQKDEEWHVHGRQRNYRDRYNKQRRDQQRGSKGRSDDVSKGNNYD